LNFFGNFYLDSLSDWLSIYYQDSKKFIKPEDFVMSGSGRAAAQPCIAMVSVRQKHQLAIQFDGFDA
jgi:hypothetical protein